MSPKVSPKASEDVSQKVGEERGAEKLFSLLPLLRQEGNQAGLFQLVKVVESFGLRDELKANNNGEPDFKLHLETDFLVVCQALRKCNYRGC